ncbi:hypothetical protein [Anatilimnocola floriformis]|uniref:hypothetical protein n=1 Tax=Anatilimnocola floriformis TaxID=2948575 RepID=UPI0020C3FDEE|nr:hypothetical protein [Anatilimnocola floriformis]
MTLLLARNEEINQWLNEHPLVLGLIFLALGALLGGWGIRELMTGVAHDKYGNAMTGGMGQMLAIVRIVGGVGCIGFALYKIAFG